MACRQLLWATALVILIVQPAYAICPGDEKCVDNPDGAGSPYKAEGSHSQYDSPYSNKSGTYSTDGSKIFSDDEDDEEDRGSLSTNPYGAYSNPYGEYGSPYSSYGINNPYGFNNPYGTDAEENYLAPEENSFPPGE
jgi:hypothetical protein